MVAFALLSFPGAGDAAANESPQVPVTADWPSADDPRGAVVSARFHPRGMRWHSSTIRYANVSREWAKPVRRAAAAWNSSGAKIRWKAVPRKRAKLIISNKRSLSGAPGETFVFRRKQGEIRLAKGFVGMNPDAETMSLATRLAAHEMGHVMGLDHPFRGCAVMAPVIGQGCPVPDQKWQSYCRILERDDVRGAVKIWGGKVRPLKKRFCDAEKEPAPVREFTASAIYSDDFTNFGIGTRLSWRVPSADPPSRYLIAQGHPDDNCPEPDSTGYKFDHLTIYEVRAGQPGAIQSIARESMDLVPPGQICFSIRALGRYERPGPAVERTVSYENPWD